MPPEYHLVIVWSAARAAEKRILEDLAARFEIVEKVEVEWTPERFADNLTRFYGTALPPGSYKEVHVGVEPFLAVVIEDLEPRYEHRDTSKGPALVNAAVFDAKSRYREWTDGGHRIHATNTVQEFGHDLALLFGIDSDSYRAGQRPATVQGRYRGDLVAAEGWSDLTQLFTILDATCRYLVMRNFSMLPQQYRSDAHGDIDLLVANYDDAAGVLGATKVFDEPHRVHVTTRVGGEEVYFDLRFVGDGYYDERWQRDMLERRTRFGGIQVPSEDDHFHSLLYHALVHKHVIAPDYLEAFADAPQPILRPDGGLDVPRASRLLRQWLRRHRYRITVPEPSVQFNQANARRLLWGMSRFRSPGAVAAGGTVRDEARRVKAGVRRRLARIGWLRALVRRARSLAGR